MTDEIKSPSAVMAQTGGTVKQAQSIAQPTGRHRLELRCPTGNPNEATIHLDGEQLTFVSRIEFVADCNTREVTAKLTIPGAYLDIDVDAAAFVTAHTEGDDDA